MKSTKNEQDVVGLFRQIAGQVSLLFCSLQPNFLLVTSYFIVKYGRKHIFCKIYVFTYTVLMLSTLYPRITWQLADDIF